MSDQEQVAAASTPLLASRDQNGLLKGVEYKFTKDGFVDWKKMIPKEYIVINTENYKGDCDDISKIEDKHLMILLGGIKEVAKIRGLFSRVNRVVRSDDTCTVVECTVKFIPNFETGGEALEYSEVGSAGAGNVTNDMALKFKETIAANRAFVRAVRNALRIDIVASDEMDKASYKQSGNIEAASGTKPGDAIRSSAKSMKIDDFDEFKSRLISRIEKGDIDISIDVVNSWSSWDSIDGGTAFVVLDFLKKIRENSKKK